MIGEPVPNATGVSIVRSLPTNGHVWRVVEATRLEPGNSSDNVTIRLRDENGNLLKPSQISNKIRIFQGWPEIDTPAPDSPANIRIDTDDQGFAKADAFCNGYWNPAKTDHGPYYFWILDNFNIGASSEYAVGYGPILNHHFQGEVVFQWTPVPPGAPPAPPPEPPPPPPPAPPPPSSPGIWSVLKANGFPNAPIATIFNYNGVKHGAVYTADGGILIANLEQAGFWYFATAEEASKL